MIPLATWDIRFRQRHESGRITPHAIVASVQYAPSGLSDTSRTDSTSEANAADMGWELDNR
jgi:hypothetical protein